MVIAHKDWYHFCVFTLSDYFVQGIRFEPTALAEMKPVLSNFFSNHHFSMHMDIYCWSCFSSSPSRMGHQEQIFPLCVCVCVCWCGSVHRCGHAEMNVFASLCHMLNNSATPALQVLPRSYPNLNNLSVSLYLRPCHASSVYHQVFWFLE